MNNFRRCFALCVCILMIVSIFSACTDKNAAEANESSPSDSVSDTGISTADIDFKSGDEATFTIVKPDNANETVTACAMSVFKKYKETTGVVPKNNTDYNESNGAEILIGDCNRESTKAAKKILLENGNGRVNEYIICTIGDDIVIFAFDDSALKTAVDYFNETYLASTTVSGGINKIYVNSESYEDYSILNVVNIKKFNIVRPLYNLSYIVQLEIDKLCDDLVDKGGYKLDVVTDKIASTNRTVGGTLTKTEEKEYEIIIGNCERNGVSAIYDSNKYEIRVEGTKIYLNGGNPQTTAMAVSEFYKALMTDRFFDSAEAITDGDFGAVIGNYDTAEKYTLTWADDFEGNEIDTTKWIVEWDKQTGYDNVEGGKKCFRGSSKLKNNYVKDGMLYMEARETEDAYYGGMLHNQGIMQYRYGYIEISTMHPKGDGFWQALYTMSAVGADCFNNVDALMSVNNDKRMYYSETDVDESLGSGTWCYTHVHAWPTRLTKNLLGLGADDKGNINLNHKTYSTDDRGYWQDFHTFGFEWLDNEKVSFFVDGILVHQNDFSDPEFGYPNQFKEAYSQAVFMRLGLAVGTSTSPAVATEQEWNETNKYIVDYIHVYQLKGHEFYLKNGSKWDKTIIA